MQPGLFELSAGVLIAVSGMAAPPQSASPYRCVVQSDVPRGGGTQRVNGFTIEIESDPAAGACHASIRSPQGEIVYEGDNNLGGIDIDAVTGKDINGDGLPDAVLVDDPGGVHYDNYIYSIVSLGPKPGKIQQLDGTVSFEDLKGDGKIEILLGASFFGFHGFSRANTPGSHVVLRLAGDRLENLSTLFPKSYDGEIQYALDDLKNHKVTIAKNEDDQSSVLSIVFAYLYSGRPAEARKTLDKYWPAAERESIRKEILSAYCAGVHKRLSLPTPSVCSAGDF